MTYPPKEPVKYSLPVKAVRWTGWNIGVPLAAAAIGWVLFDVANPERMTFSDTGGEPINPGILQAFFAGIVALVVNSLKDMQWVGLVQQILGGVGLGSPLTKD